MHGAITPTNIVKHHHDTRGRAAQSLPRGPGVLSAGLSGNNQVDHSSSSSLSSSTSHSRSDYMDEITMRWALCDYGLTSPLLSGLRPPKGDSRVCWYEAPEGAVSTEGDVWSVGCVAVWLSRGCDCQGVQPVQLANTVRSHSLHASRLQLVIGDE